MNDLLQECMSDLKTKDQAGFVDTFCERCRQPGCHRAKWAGDKFGSRVANQVDRLFHSEKADPTSSRYEHLQDFKNLMTEAMKLELSDRRGDWNVPNIPDFDKVQMPKHMIYSEPVDEPDVPVDELTDPAVTTAVVLPSRGPVVPEGDPATVVPVAKVGAAEVPRGNTAVPAGGIMLGGPEAPKKPVYDPWAVPLPVKGATVVQPGATIKMGGK